MRQSQLPRVGLCRTVSAWPGLMALEMLNISWSGPHDISQDGAVSAMVLKLFKVGLQWFLGVASTFQEPRWPHNLNNRCRPWTCIKQKYKHTCSTFVLFAQHPPSAPFSFLGRTAPSPMVRPIVWLHLPNHHVLHWAVPWPRLEQSESCSGILHTDTARGKPLASGF